MALIKCPECGKIFSNRAAHCPQCGLPTNEALELITNAPQEDVVQEDLIPTPPTVQESGGEERVERATRLQPPHYPPRFEERQAPKQRSLLTYILIVAVIVLAIVCIVLVITTSGVLKSDSETEAVDTTAKTMQVLPPDTTAIRVEEETKKPVIRTQLPEQEVVTAEGEEIDVDAQPTAEPTAQLEAAPVPASEPSSAPAQTE